jgi:ribosomal protein S18 acetylase RimI-like enzyme
MCKIEEFDFLDANFIGQVSDFAKAEPFQLFYFYNAINMVNHEGMDFYDAFILTNSNCKIIGLCIDGGYYFYGQNWTETELEIIRRRVNFNTFPNGFHFVGTNSLINDIFNGVEIKTVDFKDRYFYKIDSITVTSYTPHIITEPNESDIEELAIITQESHKEEYKELSQRTLEEFVVQVRELISNSDIFINRNDKEITGFCTAMYTKSDSPMIGTLFIKEKYRNKGIGKALLSFVTKKLMMEKANSCYLVTERNNVSANKVIESIGYIKIYEHMDKIIIK